MELSKILREYSRTIAGKEQLLIAAIAKGLEIIPRQLCDNAGFDATNILNKLRQKHAQGKFYHVTRLHSENLVEVKEQQHKISLLLTTFSKFVHFILQLYKANNKFTENWFMNKAINILNPLYVTRRMKSSHDT